MNLQDREYELSHVPIVTDGRLSGPTREQVEEITELYAPEWFLAENVILPSDQLQPGAGHKIGCKCDDSSRMNRSPERDSGLADDGSTPFGSHESLCKISQARDTLAAMISRDQDDTLILQDTTIFYRTDPVVASSFEKTVLSYIAQELQIVVVSLGLAELEDLAWDFAQQEAEANALICDARRGWTITDMAEIFFTTDCKPVDSCSKCLRAQKAINVLVTSAYTKASFPRTPTGADNSSVTAVKTHSSLAKSAIVVYIKDAKRILQLPSGSEIMTGLRDAIGKRRQLGEQVLLCAAVEEEQPRNLFLRYLWDSDAITNSKIFEILSKGKPLLSDFKPTDTLLGVSKGLARSRQSIINVRRIKRSLRYTLPAVFHDQAVEPSADWFENSPATCVRLLGKSLLSQEELQNVTLQITGLAARKQRVDVVDILTVLQRTNADHSNCGSDVSEDDADSTNSETTASESAKSVVADDTVRDATDDNSKTVSPRKSSESLQSVKSHETTDVPMTWEKRLQEVEDSCNRDEAKLLGCLVDPKTLMTTYQDVIIDQEVIDTLDFLVNSAQLPIHENSSFLVKMARIRGALLYGPPGTGKTHLARALAKESGSSLLLVTPSAIQSKWVGESEKLVKAAFSVAKKMAPCIIFIDEVDALFYRRSSSDRQWQRTTLNQFLNEMDGISQGNDAPFVLAATNRPQDLDDAFLRRLPEKVLLSLPDESARLKILHTFLTKDDVDSSVDLEEMAKLCKGYTGSDLRSLCARATTQWAIDQRKQRTVQSDEISAQKLQLEQSHFTTAMTSIRPTVSKRALREIKIFSRRYNRKPKVPKK